jgi:hypothetical protein
VTGVLVIAAVVAFVLFGLSRWAHMLRMAPPVPGGG